MTTPIEPAELVAHFDQAHAPAPSPVDVAAAPVVGVARPRRHRLAFWTAVLLALAATVGGSLFAVSSFQSVTSPASVAEAYLAAIARADAASALAYGPIPDGRPDLLTSDVLAAQQAVAPLSAVAVTAVREEAAQASVDVRYRLGFASGPMTVTDTIDLVRAGQTWQLAEVAVPVTIQLDAARNRSSFAGDHVPVGRHLLFPGALPISFDTGLLALPPESQVVRFAETTDHPEDVELTDAGEEAIGAALDAAVSACLDGSVALVTLCPLPSDARAVPGSVRGTMATPASTVATLRLQPGPDGLVQITADVEVNGEYQQLDFNNQRVTETGSLTVRVVATCYVTAPETIVWRSL